MEEIYYKMTLCTDLNKATDMVKKMLSSLDLEELDCITSSIVTHRIADITISSDEYERQKRKEE